MLLSLHRGEEGIKEGAGSCRTGEGLTCVYVPIGRLILDFLETDFENLNSFSVFIGKYGLAGLVEYSPAVKETEDSCAVWREVKAGLSDKQKLLKKAVYYCLDADGMEWLTRLSTVERFYVYKNAFPQEVEVLKGEAMLEYDVYPERSYEEFLQEAEITSPRELSKWAKERRFRFTETYVSHDVVALCWIEFGELVKSNTTMKRCLHCGKYFIPLKRSDERYCDRPVNGGPKTCKDVGPISKYMERVKGEPALEAYKKAYKKLHARIRKRRLTKEQFFNWKLEAEKKLEEVRSGALSLEEYERWLKEAQANGRTRLH
ncbi:MAG: DUF6076 domain-containing protein [Bacillota bacterium]